MIITKELNGIAEEAFKYDDCYFQRTQTSLATQALDLIISEVLSRAKCGEFNIEINLNKLYQFVLSRNDAVEFDWSFSRSKFNSFVGYIRYQLTKFSYNFEDKQYQYDAYPDPILIIRW